MKLVLASNSPRRKHLLALGGWDFIILPVEVDERPIAGEKPLNYVLRLAKSKALVAAAQSEIGVIVVAADTTVVDDDNILGKPGNAAEAEEMLRRLRGRVHQVYTALAVFRTADGVLLTDWCLTDVPMREYCDEEMMDYIQSGDPFDKAGAYAIQHSDFHPVELLQGCYANVMGLPLCHLARTLNQLEVLPPEDIPQVCQTELDYDCPVFQQVLHKAI